MFCILKKRYVIFLMLILIISISAIEPCEGSFNLATGKLTSVNVTSEIPIEFPGKDSGGYILIKAKVNHSVKEYTFLVDTGASIVIINKNVAEELHIVKWLPRVLVCDAANKVQCDQAVHLQSLKVGDIEVQNCLAGVLDLNVFGDSHGVRIDGILGNNFLKFLSVKIDYAQKVLTLSSRKANDIQPTGYTVKLYWDYSGAIFTKIKIGPSKSPISAIIDTGAGNGVYLNIPFKYMKKLQPELNCQFIKTIGYGVSGVSGQSQAFLSRLSTVELGGFKAYNLPVEFSEYPKIGISNLFLSQFTVTFDFSKLEMSLVPNENKPFKTNYETLGMVLRKEANGTVRIIGIWEGSPAEQNGLKVGDEIMNFKINGNDVSFDEMLSLLREDQNITFRFQVINSSGKREVELKKANLLPEIMEQ
jgi:predicted aspartyl protease